MVSKNVEVSQLRLRKKSKREKLEAKIAKEKHKLRMAREAEAQKIKKMNEPTDIGMHPGIKGRHFFELGVERATPLITEMFQNKVKADLSSYGWLERR